MDDVRQYWAEGPRHSETISHEMCYLYTYCSTRPVLSVVHRQEYGRVRVPIFSPMTFDHQCSHDLTCTHIRSNVIQWIGISIEVLTDPSQTHIVNSASAQGGRATTGFFGRMTPAVTTKNSKRDSPTVATSPAYIA